MNKIVFDPNEEGGLELARAVALERLRTDKNFNIWNDYNSDFSRFVEYVGDPTLSRGKFLALIQDVFWEFVVQGIIAPGNSGNDNFPSFHLTEYGKKVVAEGEYPPHDPTNYLKRFQQAVGTVDPTVAAYLSESLNCFTRGCFIASTMMLGVASERAFILLCRAFSDALTNATEQTAFIKILESNAIKSKEDWVSNKIQSILSKNRRALPDNVNTMLTLIFDFIRVQRNDIGHPQDNPPKVTREDAFVNLRLFPNYYKMLNEVIEYLSKNKV